MFFVFSAKPPSFYKVYYRKKDDVTWSSAYVSPEKKMAMIEDLLANTVYQVYVVACDGKMEGLKSLTVTVTTTGRRRFFEIIPRFCTFFCSFSSISRVIVYVPMQLLCKSPLI